MESKKVFFIINKFSGTGYSDSLEGVILKYCQSLGLEATIQFTQAPGHATTLAKEASLDGFPLVFAMGGDGTVNEVACGLAGTATTWHWPSVGYTPAPGEIIRVNTDIRRESSVASAKNFGYFLDVYDNTAGLRIGRVGIANNAGSLVGIATTKNAGGTTGNYIFQSGMQWDTWYNFKMDLDFSSQTFDLLIDGTMVGADLPFLVAATDFGDADLMLSYTTGATDVGYFDNYSVLTVIPEPSCAALLLLGVAGLALRRLKQ